MRRLRTQARPEGALAARFPETGLWPLLLQALYDGSARPLDSGEFQLVTEDEIAAIDVRQVLEDGGHGSLVTTGRDPQVDEPAPGTGASLSPVVRLTTAPVPSALRVKVGRLGLRCPGFVGG